MSNDNIDDLDDILNPRKAEIEARFRELEYEEEIEQLRRRSGSASPHVDEAPSPPPHGQGPAVEDPLAHMKAAVEGRTELERYLLVTCPHCGVRNRMSLSRVRTKNPICGGCKEDLAVPRT